VGVEQTTRKILYPPGLRLGPSALLSFQSQSVESLAATNARVRVAIAPSGVAGGIVCHQFLSGGDYIFADANATKEASKL